MDHLKGLRKRLSLFSKEAKSILTDAASSSCLVNNDTHQLESLSVARTEKQEEEETSNSVQCSSCRVTFSDREEQVSHYQLDWHRHNLKRKLKGLTSPLSQDEFEHLSGDLSSISGSDDTSSESDEEEESTIIRMAGSPLLTFTVTHTSNGGERKDEMCAVYKTILIDKKDEVIDSSKLMQCLVELVSVPQVWIVLMKSGGHFAGAVFKGSIVLDHKTFHRYTVRAKRGTIQSSRDSHHGSHKPRSAGASLRRYNEAALEQEIESLLVSWREHFNAAAAIFVRAPKHVKNPFSTSGKNPPIPPGDSRVKSIPFATRRPTFHQVKLVHQTLSTLYCGVSPPPPIPTTSVKRTQTRDISTTQLSKSSTEDGHAMKTKEETATCVQMRKEEELKEIEDGEDEEERDQSSKVKRKRRKKKEEKKVEIVDPLVERLHVCCHKNDMEALMTLLREKNVQPLTNNQLSNEESPSDQLTSDHSTSDQLTSDHSTSDQLTSDHSTSDQLTSDQLTSDQSTSDQLTSDQSASNQVTGSQSTHDQSTSNQLTSGQLTSDTFDINATISQSTCLHVASSLGHVNMLALLLDYGADPTVKDGNGRAPYEVAVDRQTRDAFRRFMNQWPLSYDYSMAQIPCPLTGEMEASRKEKKAEKRRQQKKAQKEKKKAEALSEEIKAAELSQNSAAGNLSEREKRALAAEKRMASSLETIDLTKYGKCDWCSSTLCGVIPFERLQYKYCSIDCVKEHRTFLSQQKKNE